MTIRGGKQTIGPPMIVDDVVVHKEMAESKDAKMEDEETKDEASNEVVKSRKLKPIPRPQSPFSQRLKKKEEDLC